MLEDLYDNNEYCIFTLYFIRLNGEDGKRVSLDLNKFAKHLNNYPAEYIQENIVKFHKNTGVVRANYILV